MCAAHASGRMSSRAMCSFRLMRCTDDAHCRRSFSCTRISTSWRRRASKSPSARVSSSGSARTCVSGRDRKPLHEPGDGFVRVIDTKRGPRQPGQIQPGLGHVDANEGFLGCSFRYPALQESGLHSARSTVRVTRTTDSTLPR